MYKIAVAGTGYVGLVTGVCLAQNGHKVTCVDVDKEKVETMKAGISPIYENGLEELMRENYEKGRIDYTVDYKSAYEDVDAIFIGVGTPELADGSANLSYIEKVVEQISSSLKRDCLVIVKSTVPIGTNEEIESYLKNNVVNGIRVEVASNPEFLAQGTAVKDTLHAQRIVIGTESRWAEDILKSIYKPFNIPIVCVNRRSAEMIKYASNDFLALKISYMNEIANLCEVLGADIQDVALGMSYDDRIGKKFLNAGIGYGGSCFPKDTKSLKKIAEKNNCELKTVTAAIKVNERQKTILFSKAKMKFNKMSGMKVSVLGLTFKPGTDDLREAASIENVKLLLEEGCEVVAFDPISNQKFMDIYPEGKVFNGSIKYADNIKEALKDTQVCFIFTEWDEIKRIKVDEYMDLMETPIIFDGRNVYNLDDMDIYGVEYYSIGRRNIINCVGDE